MGNGLARPHPRSVHFRVALAARNFGVARVSKFRRADIERESVSCPFEICVFMATQAISVGHALRIKDLSDLVRLVTVHTGGQYIGFFLPQFASDDLAVNGFDLGVAFGAGGGNVPASNGGGRIGMRQNHVGGMTGDARGRHDEPFPEQTLTVDALGKVFKDIVLVDGSVALNRCPFLVTFAADEGNFEGSHSGARVFDRQNVVVAMTIDTARGQRVAPGNRFPVQRAGMLFLFAGMACPAINFGQWYVMR